MSGVQLKDSALKAKEKSNEPATTTTTAATTIGKKTLTSSAALSLFDQLKNGVNLSSLTVGGATETTKATAAAAATTASATTATAATLAPPATPPPNIDLKPPPKPLKASTATRTFNTPILLPPTSSIGIVHGTKRGRDNGNSNGNDNDNCAAPATLSHCRTAAAAAAKLDINALRSQLYQGARKTATTTKTTTTATAATSTKRTTATTTTTTAATRGDRGGIKKKRCLDRYDSSESSDRYVELSLIQLKV
ncbi:uncharacterized protein LOC117567426 isoform X2 [Drosophila albomicans]|uniref:Uncharacterized protein LOC117567426 isoform X2 n=1 Tax=Drosophila albomicans TaxID=7291 RepID=A0A9C6T277_DROAB|nr:uncharacterized protein LOC117567426 isoform X2 [Drosophila albomicans]